MPTPGTTPTANLNPAQERILAALAGDDQRPATRADVQALTDVITELVALLQPPSALIITGAEAERQFAQLRAEWRKPGGLLDGPFM